MASTNVSWAIRVFGRNNWDATRGELGREGERVVRGTTRVKDEGLGARHSRRRERRASRALRGVVEVPRFRGYSVCISHTVKIQ